jgi:hypothetical protein
MHIHHVTGFVEDPDQIRLPQIVRLLSLPASRVGTGHGHG